MTPVTGKTCHAGIAGGLPASSLIAGAVPLMPPCSATGPAPSTASLPTVAASRTTHSTTHLSPTTPLGSLLGMELDSGEASAVVVSRNIPPIPVKIAQKILWKKEYVDLESLLPTKLGLPEPTLRDLVCGEKKKEKKGVSTIQEWVACFNAYTAVILMKEPDRATDLLAYCSLIVRASTDYAGEAWLGYDRFFRRQAAAEPARFPQWGEISPSIWTQHFSLAAVRPTCEECGSREHKHCPKPGENPGTSQSRRWGRRPRPYPAQKPPEICKRWNWGKECDVATCILRHGCMECEGNHRVSECPRRQTLGKEKAKMESGSRREERSFRAKK